MLLRKYIEFMTHAIENYIFYTLAFIYFVFCASIRRRTIMMVFVLSNTAPIRFENVDSALYSRKPMEKEILFVR